MSKEKKHTYDGKSREERMTGKAPFEEALDEDSREYKATHPTEEEMGDAEEEEIEGDVDEIPPSDAEDKTDG